MLLRQGYLTFIKWWFLKWKLVFLNLNQKLRNYRKYENFSNGIFTDTLLEDISQVRINNDDDRFNDFSRICRNTLDRFSPHKKSISEVIMHRLSIKFLVSRLRRGQIEEINI